MSVIKWQHKKNLCQLTPACLGHPSKAMGGGGGGGGLAPQVSKFGGGGG